MLFFAAGIFSDRGAGVPDPEGDPGKGEKLKISGFGNFVIREKRPE